MEKNEKEIKVLFVCMGNICRSPSAEAVMQAYVDRAGLSRRVHIDSAGTIAYHAGEPADSRMQKHALQRGYDLRSISRQIRSEDFEDFDYIVAMDQENLHNMKPFNPHPNNETKVSLMTDYCSQANPGYVPDPYYGGAAGFEQVLDLLEDACEGLLQDIRDAHQL